METVKKIKIGNEKFKNKYRVKTARLNNWNYVNDGYYFITICTKNRERIFGKIENEKMILNNIGEIAKRFWLEIPVHFTNTELDEFIIMPNHVHGIVMIDNNLPNNKTNNVETLQCNVSTGMGKNNFYSKISPKPKSLSTIIRSYKSICTKTINQTQKNILFAWQTRFFDHIIRNEKSLNNIRQYILDNPLRWEFDKKNQGNVY